MLFSGSGVALVTPFDKDLNINYSKVNDLIDFHLKNNTDAIIVCGTTGESATLRDEEFKELISFVISKVNKKIPVIVGSGSNNTYTAIKKSILSEKLGADALLIVTPYYNKCTQKGLYLHYKEINDNISIPIILYNVPSRTGVNILPDTVLKLSKLTNVCGIKEASGNISQVSKIISSVPNDFFVYSGNDDQTLPILSLGGKGVISVFANIYPNIMHKICNEFFIGNIKNSKNLYYKYLDIMNALFLETNPIVVKEAMNILNFEVGNCRLPLCKMDSKNINILKKILIKKGSED